MSENAIGKLPDDVTGAGLQFNYAVWTPGTVIRLCKVPWDSEYRNIVEFDSADKLKEYLEKQGIWSIVLRNMSYARPGNPVRIPLPLGEVYEYNYLHVYNPAQPVVGDKPFDYFYFIKDCRHIAPNTTEIIVQLDVWQTFGRTCKFGYGYIERGHLGIAAVDNYDNNGRDYLTVPEGLDLGGEYTTEYPERVSIVREGKPHNQVAYIITSTVSLMSSGGSVSSPTLNASVGSKFSPMVQGIECYYCASNLDLMSFFRAVSDKPWVSQGIISITACPPLNIGGNEPSPVYSMIRGFNASGGERGFTTGDERYFIVPNNDPKTLLEAVVPKRYGHLHKFKTFPYTYFTITSYNGKPVVYKPELIPSSSTNIKFALGVINIPFPPSPRVAVFVPGYGTYNGLFPYGKANIPTHNYGKENALIDPGMFLDSASFITALPTTSMTNNGYLSYMAANHNSIAHQYSSADWSQQRAMASAQNAYDNAGIQNRTAMQHAGIQQWQNRMNTELAYDIEGQRAGQKVVNSAISGVATAAGGNFLGGIIGGLQGMGNAVWDQAINNHQTTMSNAIANMGIQKNANATSAMNSQIADNNYSLAGFVAKGDYENTIAGINAKVQDAKLTQPSVSGQLGGDGFSFSMNDGFYIYWQIHAPFKNVYNMIGEYWLRYGYAINRFWKPDILSLMKRFTYWKFKELNIVKAACGEVYKGAIRGIFEKGVTVWRNADDIGAIDIGDNLPRTDVKVELKSATNKHYQGV